MFEKNTPNQTKWASHVLYLLNQLLLFSCIYACFFSMVIVIESLLSHLEIDSVKNDIVCFGNNYPARFCFRELLAYLLASSHVTHPGIAAGRASLMSEFSSLRNHYASKRVVLD